MARCRTSQPRSKSKVTKAAFSLSSSTHRCRVTLSLHSSPNKQLSPYHYSKTETYYICPSLSILLCDQHRRRASPPLGEVPCLRATLHCRGEQASHALQRRRWPTSKLLKHLLSLYPWLYFGWNQFTWTADPSYLNFLADDFLRLLLCRYIFCDALLRIHRCVPITNV